MSVKDWELYEAGKKYNNQLSYISGYSYYDLVDALNDFYNGNQWRNMESNTLRKPVFNILQKALRYFVASLTSANTKVNLETLEYQEGMETPEINAANLAEAEVSNLLEKFKFDNFLRDALFKSGTTGDVAAHFYFDMSKKPYGGQFGDVMGEIEKELVSGKNIFFGNANNYNTSVQPWIGITGRDMVDNLKAEAKQYRANQTDIDSIQEDTSYNDDIEIKADGYGKAQYFIVYRKDKKTGAIKASKCVESAYIYEDIDTGLTEYPVAWLCWEKMENTYHGKTPLAEILETQIFINLMFAMIMLHQSNTAFPKAIYNADYIDSMTNEVASSIAVQGVGPETNLHNLITYSETGNISNQLTNVIQMAFDMVKDILGVNDAALGNVDPTQASGIAIVSTAKQAAIPLENIRANMYEWVEDITRILLDMMGTYYGIRPVVISKDNQRYTQQFDFRNLKNLWLNVRIDVGETSIFSDIARKQTLDNLLNAGRIEMIDYLERLDDSDISDRQGLIDKQKELLQKQTMDQAMGLLSPEEQAVVSQNPELMQQAMQK